ncbi:hypothetical protein [Polynucleobacter sp. MWH-UH2A]|uniref:hypothetical protein n=1 Tax=Polynucleobacter sp. MWH-UH2A TaxID=1855617 RepID=UPI001BFD53C7|nr:hypothetical protein [Polynucleobacter sp. MWH-UH2A]QWD64596.1 hypothetical protein IC571_02905 [Polynucleobacter sp. MWH-UH2A]
MAKVKAFAKFVLKGVALFIILLILLYAGFKAWEYQTVESKRAENVAHQNRLKNQYEDLARDQVSYIPLMVGSPSLDYVQRGNGESIFAYLLGSNYKLYQELMEDSGQIVYVGKQILGAGCKKQGCADGEAAFVVDPESSRYYAAINQDGKVEYYGIEDGSPAPVAFQKWHGSQTIEGAK